MLSDKLIKDPCKYGNCLVKASCRLLHDYPWTRSEKCPDYAKHRKRKKLIDNLCTIIPGVFWGCILFMIGAFVLVAFSWGVFEEYKLIKGWLF